MARYKRTDHIPICLPDHGQTATPEPGAQRLLSRAEIAAHGISAATAGERRRWQVIGLLADGIPLTEIVAATGCRPRTIRQIARRYQESGPAGLVDGRQSSPGAAPILPADQQDELRRVLQNPSPDGGVWTGPKVARWIAARTGKRVHRQRGWEYLRRLGSSAAPVSGGRQAAQARDGDAEG